MHPELVVDECGRGVDRFRHLDLAPCFGACFGGLHPDLIFVLDPEDLCPLGGNPDPVESDTV